MDCAWLKHLILTIATFALPMVVLAAPSGVTYQGRILKPNGEPLNGSNVQFRLQIRAPDANNCLMYEELQAQNMSGSGGNFSLTINDGSGVRQDLTGLGLDRVFANRGSLTFDPTTCAAGNDYVAGSSDGRVLQVFFKDETMATWEPMPPQKINFVPFAFESKQIAGFTAQNLLRFAEADGTLVNTAPLNNAQYTELLALVNGTSTAYERAGRLGGVALPALGAGQAGQVLGWNGTGWETTDTVPTNSIATGKIQDSAVTSAKIADGTIAGSDLAANISINTTGTISTSGTLSSNISTARDVRIYDNDAAPNENYVSLKVPASLSQNYSYVWPATYGAANQVLTTDGAGALTWAAPSAATQWSNGAAGAIFYNGGNVGIGTGSPAFPLDVSGRINAAGFQSAVNNGTIHEAIAISNTAATAGTGVRASFGRGGTPMSWITSIVEPTTTDASLTFATRKTSGDPQERLRIDSNGNVGIGTTNPAYPLDVMGTVQSSGYIQRIGGGANALTNVMFLNYNGSGVAYTPTSATSGAPLYAGMYINDNSGSAGRFSGINFMSGNAGGYVGAINAGSTTGHIAIGTQTGASSYAERVRIDAGGNVGIGLTAPAYKLDVSGDVNVTGSFRVNGTAINTSGGTPGGANRQVQFNNSGAFAGSADLTFNSTNGWLGLNMTPIAPLSVSPKGSNFVAAKFKGNSSYKDVVVGLEGYDSAGRLMLDFFRPGVSSHSMVVDENDNFFWGIGSNFNGPGEDLMNMAPNGSVSLGKGTTAPNGKLDIKGSIVMSGATSGYAGFRVPAAAGSSVWQLPAADGSSGQALVTNGSGVLSWNSMAAANYWSKSVNDISYSNGNVGIGTATPTQLLDVNGNSQALRFLGTGGSAAFPDYAFSHSAAGNGAGMFYTGSDQIGFSTASAERMRINASGNVGIGTASPSTTLEVSSPTNATFLVTNTNPTNNPFSSIALKNYRGTYGYGDPTFAMYAANGLPGSPGPLLTDQLFLNLEGRGFSEAGFWDEQPSSFVRAYASDNWGGGGYKPSYLMFGTSTTERMRITANGNVGIGLTAPTEKLEVSGNIKATNFVSTSDARLKKNVVKTPGLDYILKLTGVQWQWKSDDRIDAGVIAQEVERVMPFAVVTDAKSGYKAVKYNALIAPLIESTKEIYGMCRETEERVDRHERSIASVQEENKRLSAEVSKLKAENEQVKRELELIKRKLGL